MALLVFELAQAEYVKRAFNSKHSKIIPRGSGYPISRCTCSAKEKLRTAMNGFLKNTAYSACQLMYTLLERSTNLTY